VSKPDPFPDIVISAETADQITYVVPRLTDIILGGVYQHHNDDLRIDEATADAIWLRCLALRPELEGSKILEHRTGLRPGRSSPRLEAERLGSTTIIHNYGHGSIGHTLAWGCAEWVLAQVQSKVA
jgi:D-amino-acid oxidase